MYTYEGEHGAQRGALGGIPPGGPQGEAAVPGPGGSFSGPRKSWRFRLVGHDSRGKNEYHTVRWLTSCWTCLPDSSTFAVEKGWMYVYTCTTISRAAQSTLSWYDLFLHSCFFFLQIMCLPRGMGRYCFFFFCDTSLAIQTFSCCRRTPEIESFCVSGSSKGQKRREKVDPKTSLFFFRVGDVALLGGPVADQYRVPGTSNTLSSLGCIYLDCG